MKQPEFTAHLERPFCHHSSGSLMVKGPTDTTTGGLQLLHAPLSSLDFTLSFSIIAVLTWTSFNTNPIKLHHFNLAPSN